MIAPRGKSALAREQLEGWWWPRICAALQGGTAGTIPVAEVEQKLDDIRDGFKRDALPFDMEHIEPPQAELDMLDQMRFVRQLQGIGIGTSRLQFAKRDFYRASAQRSQWARRNLIFDGEVYRFDKTLIEEWRPRRRTSAQKLRALPDASIGARELFRSWTFGAVNGHVRLVTRIGTPLRKRARGRAW